MTNTFNAYEKRNAIIREMGYSSYADYLSSPLWWEIRSRVLDRDGHKCRACGHHANQVHHRKYSVLAMAGSDLSDLESICGKCHKRIEFRYSTKRPLHMANTKLTAKARKLQKHMAWNTNHAYRQLVIEKKRLQAIRPQPAKEIGEVSKQIRDILASM